MSGSVRAVLEGKERKQPYHGDLAKAGELKLKFQGNPAKSQYPDKSDDYPGKPEHRLYCYVVVEEPDGTEEKYSYEPDTVRVVDAIKRAPKNTWLLVTFDGAMEDADVLIRDMAGNVVADSSGQRDAEVTMGEAHANGGGQAQPAGDAGEVTAAHLMHLAMLNASSVLSQFVEDLGMGVPEDETAEGFVGHVPLQDWLRLCKEVGATLLIRQERTGIPLGPIGLRADAEGYGGGEQESAPEGADLDAIPVTAETMEKVDQLSRLVSDKLSDEQQDVVGHVLDAKVTEARGRAVVRELTKVINRTTEAADAEREPAPQAG